MPHIAGFRGVVFDPSGAPAEREVAFVRSDDGIWSVEVKDL